MRTNMMIEVLVHKSSAGFRLARKSDLRKRISHITF